MKLKKSLKKRIAAGFMSAAMLTSATATTTMMSASAADNDYYEALALSLYFYDANACGSDVGENVLTWRGDCHTEDETALLSNAVNFDSSFKSLVDPDGDGKIDVGGGYHDAGDHIKFNLTMGFGIGSLAMSEYLNPGIYEKAGCKEHMMAILKRNAEYLMKTTFLNSSGDVATICYVVADGGADHSMMTPPEEQHYDRTTYWLTASSNNSAACGEMASALAGAAYVWKDTDAGFAKECLKYAKAIYNFGSQHKGNEMTGQSPYYSTDADSQDELLLAQAWLWINGEGAKPTTVPVSAKYNDKYDGYRYTWDKVYQGYAALMYKATKDTAFKQELEYEIATQGGVNAGKYNGDGWGAARYNCALQMSALVAADGNASSNYATGAKWQMDYILGDNPLGYSFLIGYGNKWPTHIHHRAANPGNLTGNPEVKYTPYGCLVGGIDASGQYQDHSDMYQYTEGALDYNGSFALACAGLANLYGGSDKGAANIAKSASEITYPFNFLSGTVTPTPQPTETEPVKESTETTKQTTPTPVQTDPVQSSTQPVVSGEKEATITDAKDEEGKSYWVISTAGATKLTLKVKTNSNDTEANGVFNAVGGWSPEDWSATVSGGTYTLTYDVPAGQNAVEFRVWWPTSSTIESAILTVAQAATSSTSTTSTTTTSTTTTTTTTKPVTQPSETGTTPVGNIKLGDANCDGKVDILDVIAVNKAVLGKGNLSEQGLKNIDFNKNNAPDSEESLTVMKLVVKLLTENDIINNS